MRLLMLSVVMISLMISTECRTRNRGRQRAKKEKNCYEKLGVPTDAHEKVIKKAFRKLALKYHPDKVKEEDREASEDKFKELAHCYEILSDEDQRQKYDASGYNEEFATQGGPAGAGNFHFQGSFEDIFSNFFGENNAFGFDNVFGHQGRSNGGFQRMHFGGSPGADFGQQGGFQFNGGRPNQNMYGGHHQHEPQRKKPKAQKVYVDLSDLMDDSFHTVSTKRRGNIELEIPKGCPEGHVIEENGVQFEIHTKVHDEFRRGQRSHKSDLYKNVSISLEEALLGFNMEILTLDNELIEQYVDNMPHSQELQIKRKGLPRFGEGTTTRGHLYVHFDVQLPTLKDNEKESLKEYLKENKWDYSESKNYRKKQIEKQKRRNKRKNQYKTEL